MNKNNQGRSLICVNNPKHININTLLTSDPCMYPNTHLEKQRFFTLAFLWLRLSEDSLKVMEGLCVRTDALGDMSWWGLRQSQLLVLSR